MDTKNSQKMPQYFNCDICDFNCNKKSNYTNHLLTSKHQKRYNCIQNSEKKIQKNAGNSKKCRKQ